MYSPTRFSIDVPAGADADRHQEHRQHDQHQRDAINAQLPGEAREQRRAFGELPLRAADVVIGPQHGAEREIDQRCEPARWCAPCFALTTRQATARHQRHQQHQGEDGKSVHRLSPPSPS
jgi:hypothetical protein